MSVSRPLLWVIAALGAAYAAFGLMIYGQQEKVIYFPDPERVEVAADGPIEEVIIETPDGESLVAWYMPASEGCPTLLMFHGNASHIGRATAQYERIHEAGAGMLAVAWRGYSGSTGTPTQEALYSDAETVYAALKATGISPDNIVIHGFSLGASPATYLAARNNARALILEAPFYSAQRLAQEQFPIYPASLMLRHKYPTNRFIAAVDEPILIVHGSADTLIPAEHSADLAALARVPVQRRVFEGSDHNSLVRDGLYEEAVWPFLTPLYPNCPFTMSAEVTPI